MDDKQAKLYMLSVLLKSDSSLLLLHTKSQTLHIAYDTEVEFTPRLTEYCFILTFHELLFFCSRC